MEYLSGYFLHSFPFFLLISGLTWLNDLVIGLGAGLELGIRVRLGKPDWGIVSYISLHPIHITNPVVYSHYQSGSIFTLPFTSPFTLPFTLPLTSPLTLPLTLPIWLYKYYRKHYK